MTTADDYRHRTTRIREGSRELEAVIANGLFSRGGVDSGTAALLTSLRNQQPSGAGGRDAPAAILDVGCGWGALTLALAARYPDAQVVGTDRDLLAVRTTAHNAAVNELPNVTTTLALGYEAIDAWPPIETFDWIVTNVPAKAGVNGLRQLLFGAGERLAEGGLLAVVFVNPIGDTIVKLVEELGQAIAVEVEWQQARAEHTIFHLRFPEGLPPLYYPDVPLMPGMELAPESPLWPYLRDDVVESPDGVPALAVHNVAEFDTPDYRNKLVTKVLDSTVKKPDGRGERVLAFNPRHGWLVRDVIREREPDELVLVDRNALALTVAAANVRKLIGDTGRPAFRAVTGLALGSSADDVVGGEPVTGPFDLIVGTMNSDEGRNGLRRLLIEAAELLSPDGVLVFGMAAAEVASQLKHAAQNLNWRFGRLLKRRSFAAQLLRPPKGGVPS